MRGKDNYPSGTPYAQIPERNERFDRRRVQMVGEYLAAIQQFLIMIWYFLTDRPPINTELEKQLGHLPETQAQRIRRRWQRSKERASRQQSAA
jgi:hypothetical protein